MRFIVQSGGGDNDNNKEVKHNTNISIHIIIIVIIPAIILHSLFNQSYSNNEVNYYNQIILIIICFLIIVIKRMITNNHNPKKCIVDITPLGIQINTITNNDNKSSSFIPIEIINDIIITEIVSLHRVDTCLFIRIHENISNDSMKLVSLFSDFELTYEQCENIWVQMRNELNNKKI